jgi:flagella basal body P-ring formation protein FlgA
LSSLPLFWQLFAAVYCRSVGIASADLVAHTRAMTKLTTTICMLFLGFAVSAQSAVPSNGQVDINKQQLIARAQTWVAEQEQLPVSQVQIVALDRRLKVPACESSYSISFPYANSNQTILAQCPDSDWKAFIRVKIQPLIQGFVYRRDMEANQPLRPQDIEKTVMQQPARTAMTNLETLANSGEGYMLTTAVKAGDVVAKRHLMESTQVFRLNRDVLAGESITSTAISKINLSLRSTNPSQRFPGRLLEQAVAARDLSADHILSRRDFNIKNMVIMTTSNLSRGQKLSADNTVLKEYYGNLPEDALRSKNDIVQMEAIRSIRTDQLLRLSDLRPAAMINKGDNVMLSVGSGLLTITVTMTAMESGKMDQQITLLNPESNETVRALVTGPGQARGL